jgi:hypothetical protein
MGRPTEATVKRLYLLTSNRCAFPECVHPLATPTERSIAEVCHICADQPGGPRYDPNQTEEERQGYGNLIVLCANHHLIVDGNEATFTADLLRDMKRKHESKSTKPFVISDRFARDISIGIGALAAGSILNTIARELGTLVGTISGASEKSGVTARATTVSAQAIRPAIGDEQFILGGIFKYPPSRFSVDGRTEFTFVAEGIRLTLESRGWQHVRMASWAGLPPQIVYNYVFLLILVFPYASTEPRDEAFVALSQKLVEINGRSRTSYRLERHSLGPTIAGYLIR